MKKQRAAKVIANLAGPTKDFRHIRVNLFPGRKGLSESEASLLKYLVETSKKFSWLKGKLFVSL